MKHLSSFNMQIGPSPFFFVSDHAGKAFPEHLGDLGISQADRERHIAYDIGIKEVGRDLAHYFDATLMEQHYSRLVIDCNRNPERADRIPEVSDGTEILGNKDLSECDCQWRCQNIFQPYHQKIADILAKRVREGQATCLISLHSFTPSLKTSDGTRPWDMGLLFHKDWQTASSLRKIISKAEPTLSIGENQPYFLDLDKEYTVPTHAEQNNIPYLEIELRQDILQSEEGKKKMTALLCRSLEALKKEMFG